MNSQQLQLVNFEQAKRLKQLGFDWGTKDYYNNPIPSCTKKGLNYNKMLYLPHYRFGGMEYNNGDSISAPTVPLALKWFRDVKMIGCSVTQVILIGKKSKEYTFSYNKTYGCDYCTHDFDTYESAESALLDELLTLIEKENENI